MRPVFKAWRLHTAKRAHCFKAVQTIRNRRTATRIFYKCAHRWFMHFARTQSQRTLALAKHHCSRNWTVKRKVFAALKNSELLDQSMTCESVHINWRLEKLEQSLAQALHSEKDAHSVQNLLSDIDSYRAKEWAALREVNGQVQARGGQVQKRLSQLERKILRH